MTTERTLSRAEEQRIDDKVRRGIREYFKNGLPAGTYSSYMWDGTKIVGGEAATGGSGLTLDGFSAWVNAQSIPDATWTPIVIDTAADDWDTGDYTRASDTDRLYLDSQVWLITFTAWWPVVTGTFGIQHYDASSLSTRFGDLRSVADVTGLSELAYSFTVQDFSPSAVSGRSVRVFQNTGASRDLTMRIVGQSLYDATP